ncbi:MAG: hypothetical protein AAF327_08845 [Cyanobacteria bacterium P01_A01_bin.37]
MNLPLVLDLALGLIFVYLTLSLLASEVQELITTLLQWRAEHLKKSIEVLFSGERAGDLSGSDLADRLYENPLIAALNQEARGPFATFFRLLNQNMGQTYRFITRTRNVFGRYKSGPSYIPAHTFSAAMLDDLGVEAISRQKSQETLELFMEEKLKLIAKLLEELRNQSGNQSLLINESNELIARLDTYRQDLADSRINFPVAIADAADELIQFVSGIDAVFGKNPTYESIVHDRLPFIKQAIATLKTEPTVSEVIDLILANKQYLPQQLQRNLKSLSHKAQHKAQSLTDGVNYLEDEVSAWFDRAMERSSGVYKRNAKGIAVILGFLIAVAANADTTYIVDRLSKDTVLRETITQAANQIASQPMTTAAQSEDGEMQTESIDAIRDAVNDSLETLPLPIGWNSVILDDQLAQSSNWRFPILRRLIGWLITGVAISMGASFWYGILNKVFDIKNTGGTSKE